MLNFTFSTITTLKSLPVKISWPVEKCLPVKMTTLLPHHTAVLWSSVWLCFEDDTPHNHSGFTWDFLIFLSLSLVGPLLFRTVFGSTWQLVFSWQQQQQGPDLVPAGWFLIPSTYPLSWRAAPPPRLQNRTGGSCSKHTVRPLCTPEMSSAKLDLGFILDNTNSKFPMQEPHTSST